MANLGMVADFDLAPDGQRVASIMAMAKPAELNSEHNVTFLQNVFDEVRRKTK